MKKLILILFVFASFFSCTKELPISRNHQTVKDRIFDFSTLYIDSTNSGVDVNKKNLITNTHWVFAVNRNLRLSSIQNDLQQLVAKKNKKGGIHDDNKNIYWFFLDTIHNQTSFVPFPFDTIVFSKASEASEIPYLQVDKNEKVEQFINHLIEFYQKHTMDTMAYPLFIY